MKHRWLFWMLATVFMTCLVPWGGVLAGDLAEENVLLADLNADGTEDRITWNTEEGFCLVINEKPVLASQDPDQKLLRVWTEDLDPSDSFVELFVTRQTDTPFGQIYRYDGEKLAEVPLYRYDYSAKKYVQQPAFYQAEDRSVVTDGAGGVYFTQAFDRGGSQSYKMQLQKNGSLKETVNLRLGKYDAVLEQTKGGTARFKVGGYSDKSVTWYSSDERIATVTNAGKVKTKAVGKVTLTCTSVADPNLVSTLDLVVEPQKVTPVWHGGVKSDLDGDGKKEHFTWRSYIKDDEVTRVFLLSVDGKQVGTVTDTFDWGETYFFLGNVDSRDKYIELFVVQTDTDIASYTKVYRFNGEKFVRSKVMAYWLPEYADFSDELHPQTGISHVMDGPIPLRVDRKGTVYFRLAEGEYTDSAGQWLPFKMKGFTLTQQDVIRNPQTDDDW